MSNPCQCSDCDGISSSGGELSDFDSDEPEYSDDHRHRRQKRSDEFSDFGSDLSFSENELDNGTEMPGLAKLTLEVPLAKATETDPKNETGQNEKEDKKTTDTTPKKVPENGKKDKDDKTTDSKDPTLLDLEDLPKKHRRRHHERSDDESDKSNGHHRHHSHHRHRHHKSDDEKGKSDNELSDGSDHHHHRHRHHGHKHRHHRSDDEDNSENELSDQSDSHHKRDHEKSDSEDAEVGSATSTGHKHGHHRSHHRNGHRRHHDHKSHRRQYLGDPKDPEYTSRVYHNMRMSKIMMPTGKVFEISVPVKANSGWQCEKKKSDRIVLKKHGRVSRREWTIVTKEMEKTKVTQRFGNFKSFNFIKIEKLVNPCLWRRYRFSRRVIMEKAAPNDRMLFHGSPHCLELADTGFNEQRSSPSGMFGAGLYFAENSSKANLYVFGINNGNKCPTHQDPNCEKCERHLLLCRVTLGNIMEHTTKQSYAHPPPGFHSVKGVKGATLLTNEFVVYRREQIYPEYLITYKIVK